MSRRLQVAVHCAIDARNTTGESPLWSAREAALYWVDIPDGVIHYWQPEIGTRRQWRLPAAVGSIGLRASGGLVVALRSGFHLFDLQTEALTFLCHPEPDLPSNRLNDGKVSPEGRFWAGTMDQRTDKEPIGSLYRLDADHRCARMSGDVRVSNGLAWSPDGRVMYHSDSRSGVIYRHAYDAETGALGEREIFVRMQPEWGRPDGGATDEEGCYWSCGVGEGRINRFSPDGKLIGFVEMPIKHPTMPCFGRPAGRTMYVTSHRENYSVEELARTPQAGAVFMLEPGVAGAPAAYYQD